MKVQPGASRAASGPLDLTRALRCYLVLYPGGARSWTEQFEAFARGFAKAHGGVVIPMVPEYPGQAERKARAAFAPTEPNPLE